MGGALRCTERISGGGGDAIGVVLAIIAWIVFGVLLLGRFRFGWRGRQALRWTFAGYTLLGLSYFGSKLILENILGKHWG